jgi:hypothetical protein
MSKFQHVFQPNLSISIPSVCLPKKKYLPHYFDKGYISYSQTTFPYFSDTNKDVCVLEGIPTNTVHDVNFYAMPQLHSVHECTLSNTGECTRRKVYFVVGEKEYPFGCLTLFPRLYAAYVNQVKTGCYEVKRDFQKTAFYINVDFFKKYLPDEGIEEVLDNIMSLHSNLHRAQSNSH